MTLANRIRKKLSTPLTEEMAVADHRKGLEAMLRLRDILLRGDEDAEPVSAVKMSLTCAGVALQRRLAFHDSPASRLAAEDFTTTMALLFALVVLCTGTGRAGRAGSASTSASASASASDSDSEQTVALAAWWETSLAQDLQAAVGVETNSWTMALRSPGALCRMCLEQTVLRSSSISIGELAQTGALFFRTSASAMMVSLLEGGGATPRPNTAAGAGGATPRPNTAGATPQPNSGEAGAGGATPRPNTPLGRGEAPPHAGQVAPPPAFVTLGAMDFVAAANENLDERLLSIADAAESEAGQSMLRDLILSFKLPRRVVGVRRTALLGRDANKLALETFSETLGGAHDAAMRGAKWSYEKDEDVVHRSCSLLAALGVMLLENAHSLRKDDVFNGQVQLPFLETCPPAAGVVRLALLENSNEWVVFSLNTSGVPHVQLRQRGFDGLCHAVALFASKI